jgi:hypothetical protein
MSPLVAARCGDICGTDAGPSLREDALGLHSTIRAAAHGGWPWSVPAQISKYAAPPIRSDILG